MPAKKTRKKVEGEGSYTATRNFDRAQEKFVKSHKAEIPKKGKEARRALEGKEGKSLRSAEKRARAKARS
ncbi:MAG: hypothetical protein JOZ55_05545 [Alphaproteobacteria bacterium]|nr:hypothetical protein [Alphaproteobacteria bacterium]